MKAIRYHAPGDIRVEMIDVPQCGDGELRVKIDACAVCGTDMKAYKHGNPRIKAPMVMGHEFTGIVDTIGSGVEGFAIGDRIVMATSISCGDCAYCKKGWRNLCANIAPMGFSYPGGMAEYTVIPQRAIVNGHVIKVPDGVKAEHAALAEPLSCAVNSAANSNIQSGDTVVVVGAGPMGIMNACVAQQMGASKIILAEINPKRLAQGKQFGFNLLINPATEDLAKIVKDNTDGLGADVAIVAAPAAQPQADALELVRKQGTVCLFASLPATNCMLEINSRTLHYGEIKLVGTSDSTGEHVTKAVEMIAGGMLPSDKLATHILGLDDILKAFYLMASGEALRVVLKP
jgi:L-iditol 2-dehydrogenase